VRKQKEIADRRKAEEQEKIKVKEEKRLRLKKEQEEKKEKEKKEKAEEEQRQLQLKKDQEEKEGEEQQQLQQQQQEKKEQQQLQQQQQEKTKEAVQVEVTALCEELCRRKATLREHAIIRLPVGSGEVDEHTRYKVRKLRSPARKAASVVPRLTEEMILLAPQDRSERALLGQLVMKGMLVRAPVGTKYGDEARDQAHFSFHKSKLPFKEKALQRVIQLHKAASLQQPAVPLQQPAVPLQQPAVPLQEPALPLQADPAADPAAGPAAEASQDPVQAEKIKASKEKK
jgi:flagellar biosynthesis GTPase FlhF